MEIKILRMSKWSLDKSANNFLYLFFFRARQIISVWQLHCGKTDRGDDDVLVVFCFFPCYFGRMLARIVDPAHEHKSLNTCYMYSVLYIRTTDILYRAVEQCSMWILPPKIQGCTAGADDPASSSNH
jgi:hypothetical protein